MTRLNYRRGLFRLWLIGSIGFALVVATVSYQDIKQSFEQASWRQEAILLLPTDCVLARGVEGKDYTKGPRGPWERYSSPPPSPACWYELPKFRIIFPEYNDIDDQKLSDELYAKAGIPTTAPESSWMLILKISAIAFGGPVAAFVFGTALIWAISGFSRPSNSSNG